MALSVKNLSEHLKLTAADAKKLRAEMNKVGKSEEDRYGAEMRYEHQVDRVLDLANKLIDGSGVEAINGSWHDDFYQDIVALYVNMGDPYVATLLYDTVADRWHITGWGDFVERYEKRYEISEGSGRARRSHRRKPPRTLSDGTRVTQAQISMLDDIATDGYIHGSRGCRGGPRLEAMGLIERIPRSSKYRVTDLGRQALRP